MHINWFVSITFKMNFFGTFRRNNKLNIALVALTTQIDSTCWYTFNEGQYPTKYNEDNFVLLGPKVLAHIFAITTNWQEWGKKWRKSLTQIESKSLYR